MSASTYILQNPKNPYYWGSYGYVLIEEQEIPEMYSEFAPGPKDEKEARYWNVEVSVYHINLHANAPEIKKVNYKWMNDNYKFIQGRNERIHFWSIMNHLEEMEKEE